MSQFLVVLSTWLHSLATVIFIGYYVVLALICMPALMQGPENARGAIVSAMSKRSRSWLYGSLVVFALTGFYLMLVNPSYLGIGNFANPWSILMLVKHTVIFVMLVMGFWFNAILRGGPLASSNTGGPPAIASFRSHVNAMAIAGVAVLLLTAIAQIQ